MPLELKKKGKTCNKHAVTRCHPGSRNNRLPLEGQSMDFYIYPLPKGSIRIRKCHQSVHQHGGVVNGGDLNYGCTVPLIVYFARSPAGLNIFNSLLLIYEQKISAKQCNTNLSHFAKMPSVQFVEDKNLLFLCFCCV